MQDGEVKNKLSPAQISVMRHRVTEPPYFGKFWDHFDSGIYRCAACDTKLFASEDKFDSKTGWPAFKKPLNERDLQFKNEPGPDDKVEVRCRKCKSHLGYVIAGETPYYRINSVCLLFEAREIPEIELPEKEDKKDESKKESAKATKKDESKKSEAAAAAAFTAWNIPSVAAGLAAGVVVGAGGALLYCQTFDTVMPVETATTTPIIESPATDTEEIPETPTSVTPASSPTATERPDVAGTPAGTTSADGTVATTTP